MVFTGQSCEDPVAYKTKSKIKLHQSYEVAIKSVTLANNNNLFYFISIIILNFKKNIARSISTGERLFSG